MGLIRGFSCSNAPAGGSTSRTHPALIASSEFPTGLCNVIFSVEVFADKIISGKPPTPPRRAQPDGRIMVNKQPIKIGPRDARKLVTVIIEDTYYRILHGEEELAVKPRQDTAPITRLYVRGVKPRLEPSSIS